MTKFSNNMASDDHMWSWREGGREREGGMHSMQGEMAISERKFDLIISKLYY